MGPPHTVTFEPLMHRRETLCFVDRPGVLDLVPTPLLINIRSHLHEYVNTRDQSSIHNTLVNCSLYRNFLHFLRVLAKSLPKGCSSGWYPQRIPIREINKGRRTVPHQKTTRCRRPTGFIRHIRHVGGGIPLSAIV